jgi:hypothetical protein
MKDTTSCSLKIAKEWNRSNSREYAVNSRGKSLMAKSAKRETGEAVATAANRSSKSLPNRSAKVTDSDVGSRAYDLYLAPGCEHGHDVDNWLQAERELRRTMSSTVA